MMNQRGVFVQSIISGALLLLASCGGNSNGTGSNGAAQGGTSGTGVGGSSVANNSGGGGQVGGASSGSSQTIAQTTGGQTTSTGTASQGGNTTTGGKTNGTSSDQGGNTTTGGKTNGTSSGQGGKATGGQGTGGRTSGTGTGIQAGTTSTGGQTSGATSSPASGGTAAGGAGGGGGTATAGTTGNATGGKSGASGGQGGGAGSGGQTSATGGGSGLVSGCVGKAWPTANPTAAGPFEVAADKHVGPLAGALPDPIYENEQQSFNVYRPKNLADSGYCHPILIWANGYTDNPEQNPPKCVVDKNANKWCGQYLPLMNHLASHGFVVVASLSTTTATGSPLPTIVGLDWIVQQAEDSTSRYYHRLDTANIGALGHSMGGMSTCMSASEPRYKALQSICGTSTLTGVHTPMLFFCGGKDDRVHCPDVKDVFLTVTNQPAFFMDELGSDHGSWVYGGASSPSLSSAAAWFRIHLMGDTANRKYFYGSNCTFCKDNRVQVAQNSLMTQ